MKNFKKLISILFIIILTISMAACSTSKSDLVSNSTSAKEQLVVVTWGGALEEALKLSIKDFEKENNCEIVWETSPDYAKLKSMVESGDIQWDVVTVDPDFIYRGADQDLLESMDYSIIDKTGIENNCSDYGTGAYVWATVIGYDTDKYSEDTAPTTWADFWDTDSFPGERTLYKSPLATLELALLADGVDKDDIYPLDVDRAFESLDKIKDSISTWWESGAQPAQMLSSKQVSMAQAWAGRITAVQEEGASVDFTSNEGIITTDQWAVPKGTKHRELAMKFINAITRAEAGKTFSENVSYGPVNTEAYDLLSEEILATLPSSPEYEDQVLYYNAEYWAEHYDEINEKFQNWLLEN